MILLCSIGAAMNRKSQNAKQLAALANMTSDPREFTAKLPLSLGAAALGTAPKENECPTLSEKTQPAERPRAT